jgi:aminopeptidase N
MRYRSYFQPCILAIALLSCVAACKTKKELATGEFEPDTIERMLDPIVVTPESSEEKDSIPKIYRATAKIDYDIIHTSLDLRFDWTKQHVIGTAELAIKPHFHPITSVALDAVGFDIKSVKANNGEAKYQYDGRKLTVELNKSYSRKEKFTIFVDYIAKPNENATSGSAAITSDKGLFFINPLGADPDVPQQIWTQGETENNSRWFPTFDKPTERFTQEIKITVADKFITLSNGLKVNTRKNADGTRTDHWKQDQPHAPYLAMIAVGEFHEEVDKWEGKPLHYFVEKGWAKHAKKIFNHTPEMLSFFSQKLDYPYPWDKYSQIIVKDYVSGAMENTGAVIFGDFIQKTDRELIDNDNDAIVAHEMMHHWFGDLVTCEDWSNLTLNEGFANYAEYLWQEHKYGRDRAEYHRLNEMNGYLSTVQPGNAHPLIHYFYNNKEDMFDAHSYNKGGLVLHMLRNYLGEEAFFAGLNKYLKDNAYTAVEVDELRIAFEDISGEDLHWFFDQWFMGKGHPTFNVQYDYNEATKTLTVDVDQSLTPAEYHQGFIVPFDLAIYYPDGTVVSKQLKVSEMKSQFVLTNIEKPAAYVLDGKNVVLGLFEENKSEEVLLQQFLLSPHLFDKIMAFSYLNSSPQGLKLLKSSAFIDKALNDRSHVIRMIGLQTIADSTALVEKYIDKLEKMATTDAHSEVRNNALYALMNAGDYDPTNICTLIMESEQAYPVINAAMSVLGADTDKAMKYFERFKNEPSDALATSLAQILNTDNAEVLSYLERKANTISVNNVVDFFGAYGSFLSQRPTKIIGASISSLGKIAENPVGNIYRKYMALKTVATLSEVLNSRTTEPEALSYAKEASAIVKKVVASEQSPLLKARYDEEFK